MPFRWRECCETQPKLILQVEEIHLEQNSHFASVPYLHRDVCLLTSVCTPVREALVHRLSLKVLELGERGGERQEERDFVPILARFTGFSWLPPLSTQLKSKVWSVVSDPPQTGVTRSVYESSYSPSPWQIGVYVSFKGHTLFTVTSVCKGLPTTFYASFSFFLILLYFFYETKSHSETQAALKLTSSLGWPWTNSSPVPFQVIGL